ncbi:DUF2254 domain-containing protein [Microbacterium cremeum]|uniref:DUF2254 domain-containing protein n=1 Tax=Microbacterium cremeum TaxID=2782169 RepID=UPI001886D64B|nr:DUF2254 domain-containing protein [Microbacterium cremeum]
MPDRRRDRWSPHQGRGWWARVSESIESRLWPLPLLTVFVAVGLGIVLPRVDLAVDASLPTAVHSAVFNGGAATARSVLSSIAGSLITATSLTFSLTVIALQLASSQASPRVLRLFARDRNVHVTLAAFLGTFAYSLTVLRSVRSGDDGASEFVPRIAVTVAFAMTVLSVILLVFFLAHLATQLRVETMLKEIHAETDRTIDLVGERNASAPEYRGEITEPLWRGVVVSESSGFITRLDVPALVASADDHDIVVEVDRDVGDNVVTGTPLAHWWPRRTDAGTSTGPIAAEVASAVKNAFSIRYERTAAEDIDFGVQQTVDIGLRALSPGVNDPTTAAHALGHLSAITARRLHNPTLPARLAGLHGQLSVVTSPSPRTDAIEAALTPLRHYGATHPAVVSRLLQAIAELHLLCADHDVEVALLAQLDALAEQLRSSTGDPVVVATQLVETSALRTRIAGAPTQ